MVDTTIMLTYFCGSLGFCFLAWNPFIPLLVEMVLIVGITREITANMLYPRLASGMWTLYMMRRHKQLVGPTSESLVSIILQSLLYFNIRAGTLTLLHTFSDYIYPIPSYLVLNLVMSYPFFFEKNRIKWETFLYLTLGYNLLFGVLNTMYKNAFTLEIQLILLIAPPLLALLYDDVFNKKK